MINHTESNTTNFKIILDETRYGSVERYCQNVILPGISIGPTIEKLGYIENKIPGDKISFDTLKLEILLDRDIQSYLEILDIMFENVDQNMGILNPSKALFTTKLLILDNTRNPIYELKFIDSFITNIDGLNFSHKNQEIITYGIEIYFSRYKYSNLLRTKK